MTVARRKFLLGLVATPAVVAASSLMPLRGMSMIIPSDEIDVNEIIAILNGRLDIGDYPGDAPFIQFDAYDTIGLHPVRIIEPGINPSPLNKWESSSAFPPAPRSYLGWQSIS